MSAASAAPEPLPGSERQAVVLLHCSGGSARQWKDLANALQRHFRVHAIDLHGHGCRPAWTADRALTLADDAALAAPMMDRGDVHVVGHSYGAAVALKLALLHPGRVRSVVVHEPVLLPRLVEDDAHAGHTRDLLATAALVRLHLLNGRNGAAARLFTDYWSGAGHWDATEPSRREVLTAQMPTIGSHFDALAAEHLDLDRLHARGVQALCMSGSQTVPAMRRMAALLRRALPGALHDSIDGAGHMAPVTHRAVFNARVLAFLHERLRDATAPWGSDPFVEGTPSWA